MSQLSDYFPKFMPWLRVQMSPKSKIFLKPFFPWVDGQFSLCKLGSEIERKMPLSWLWIDQNFLKTLLTHSLGICTCFTNLSYPKLFLWREANTKKSNILMIFAFLVLSLGNFINTFKNHIIRLMCFKLIDFGF